jgi:hypothetical protein
MGDLWISFGTVCFWRGIFCIDSPRRVVVAYIQEYEYIRVVIVHQGAICNVDDTRGAGCREMPGPRGDVEGGIST